MRSKSMGKNVHAGIVQKDRDCTKNMYFVRTKLGTRPLRMNSCKPELPATASCYQYTEQQMISFTIFLI